MKSSPTQPTFRTRDLAEAAALSLVLNKIPTLQQTPGQTVVWFHFSDRKATDLASRFWSSRLRVDARMFALTMRGLKDLLFRGSR